MKGQTIASAKMEAYISGCERGELHRPVLISGPSGVGKSRLSNEFEKKLENLDYEIFRLDDSSTVRTVSDFKKSLKPVLENGHRTAIFLDECQNLIGRKPEGISPIVTAQLRALIYPHGEIAQVKHWVPISVKQDEIINVNFRNILLIFMTNEPDKLETTTSLKKNEYPFRRRFFHIELTKYPDEIIPEIIEDMCDDMGLKINDCSKKIIARFHRGTLEALSVVLAMYRSIFPGQKLITKDKLLEAAKMTQFFPRGLIKTEVRLLELLNSNGGQFQYSIAGTQLNSDQKAIAACVGFLSNQKTDGIHTPFLTQHGPKICLTANGQKYLEVIKKEGFSVL